MNQEFEEIKKKLSHNMVKPALEREAFGKALTEEFPFMRRGDSQGAYDQWGLEISKGWFELLHNLCKEISTIYEKAEQPVDIVADQVKEKFAKLRFYYHTTGQKLGIHTINSGDGIRITSGSSALHLEIINIIHRYELQSASTCEICGASAELRKDIGYHVQTLCDACYAPRKQRYNEHQLELQQRKLLDSKKRQQMIKAFLDDKIEDALDCLDD